MDFTRLTLDIPLLLDSSQAWGPERILEEQSFIDTVPRNDEGFSLLPQFEQSYTSQESEFGLDDSPEFEDLLCGFAEQIESQRPALIETSQEAQLESFMDPEHEDAEGETLISRSSQNKENDPATAEIKGGDASSSRVSHLSWDCKSTEIDFSSYTVTSQARYEVERTFQESKSRGAVNRAVAAVLGNETANCTLGEVIGRMKREFLKETGESVLSQPMGPFFSNTNFSAEFDDYTQQAGVLEVKKKQGSGYYVGVKLKPLTREVYSHRFNREFGSRFLKLSRPRHFQGSLGRLTLEAPLCDAIMRGMDILGRHWEAIHASDISKADKEADMESSSVIMFAVSGDDIPTQAVSQPIKWMISPSQNQEMSTAKYNARIKLGFSRTVLVPLENVQIKEEKDLVSTIKFPMTDGCGTATFAVLKAIAEKMGLDYVPSYFQIRHGGRKGLILLDVENSDSESLRITYRKTQIKFETRQDLNIEVVDYARPLKRGKITSQFLTILHNGGVSKETLGNLAKEEIEKDGIWELLERAGDPSFVKNFYQSGALKKRRDKDGCFKYAGSMPASAEERIIQMVDAGFAVSECLVLKNLISGCNKNRLDSWNDLKFTISESTSVKCAPDFKKVLREGEVFLQFSSDGFVFNDKLLKFLSGKVLVGRSPAYIASDIQSAIAVMNPEVLEAYGDLVDCIVFPIVGEYSLASRLSGGDYDGDSVLVIWDQRVVEPFSSRLPPKSTSVRKDLFKESTEQDTVGCYLKDNEMDEDATIKAILRAEIPKMLSDSNVGICTLMHKKVSYYLGIDHPLSIRLAELACLLLDAPKQGLTLETERWEKIQNEVDLILKNRAEPLYLRKGVTYSRFQHEVQTLESVHVLDYIKGTILGITEAYEQNFKAKFPDIFTDHDISDSFSEELEYYMMTARDPSRSKNARELSNEIYEELLSFRKHRLDKIVKEYGRMYPGSDFKSFQPQSDRQLDKANKEKLFAIFQEIAPSTRSENLVLEDWGRSAGEPFGKWNLLKASALFQRCWGSKPMLPFIVACPQLCYLKASARGRPFRLVQEAVYLDMYTKRLRLNTQVIDAEASEVKEGGASGAGGTRVIS
ncbi:hypothetical protein AOL_s00173g244 [Orbilia oligospora ATCC 24927]|uniref:RNA-dependent RNA polymerase n=1 Tax=Arthrobotrys oligospora (strain ATCC 24927 / CBS 115.81 / DSM 1491) TaxID=756982 RepID=G1XP76_ARTOA|nr:hypothetical protein AOL_s00173g244 [Orbilia oligospora ATCC 24927]EGX45143.1 hypothetical protein AOL_s00173g244 [Orbilia oligospora ATCC 24927]